MTLARKKINIILKISKYFFEICSRNILCPGLDSFKSHKKGSRRQIPWKWTKCCRFSAESALWEGQRAAGGWVPQPPDPLQQTRAPHPDPGRHQRRRRAGGPGGGGARTPAWGRAPRHHLHRRLAGGIRTQPGYAFILMASHLVHWDLDCSNQRGSFFRSENRKCLFYNYTVGMWCTVEKTSLAHVNVIYAADSQHDQRSIRFRGVHVHQQANTTTRTLCRGCTSDLELWANISMLMLTSVCMLTWRLSTVLHVACWCLAFSMLIW